jgi:replication-associated recombination protein RarA
VANPYPSAFLFTGAAGTGKATLGLAVAAELQAQVIPIPSAECTVDRVRELRDITRNGNMFAEWNLILVDEADRMSPVAQVAFLSMLDATGFPPNTIFIFTSNSTKGLEPRFLSRCRVIEFDGAAESAETANYLLSVWVKETGRTAGAPRMPELIKRTAGNIRSALMELEMEIIVAGSVPKPSARDLEAAEDLARTLRNAGIDSASARLMTAGEWATVAKLAGCNAPSKDVIGFALENLSAELALAA